MPFSILAIAIVPAIAACAAGGISIYAWQRREVTGARTFALCTASTFIWCFFSVFEYLSLDESTRITFGKAQYWGISFFPLFWLLFTLRYAQYDDWLNRKSIAVLSVVPTASLVLSISDRWHGWIWQSATLETVPYPHLNIVHGWWFNYVMIPQCYVLLLAGVGVLLSALFSGPKLYHQQILILLIAALSTFVCNVLYVVAGVTLYGLDLTPVGFAIAGVLLQFGLFRAQFLAVNPISYKTVFLNTADAVIVLDAQRRIVDINPRAQKELALAPTGTPKRTQKPIRERALGRAFEQVFIHYRSLAHEAIFWETGHTQLIKTLQFSVASSRSNLPQVAHREVQVRSLQTAQNIPSGWLIIIRDITLEKQQQAQLEQLAYIDSLTGLYNRRQLELKAQEIFHERLLWEASDSLPSAQPAAQRIFSAALLYIDLNDFKGINDNYGHEVGDQVLKHFAYCLKRSVRQGDMVVRLGGDEFAALLYRADQQAAMNVRTRLQALLSKPVHIADYISTLSASIGVACYPNDGHSLKALLHSADTKMYREKQLLRNH